MDRNYNNLCQGTRTKASLSARRAWIEIFQPNNFKLASCVALRKESVDRNFTGTLDPKKYDVALRKESVDRNRNSQYSYFLYYGVALRKESVDRNFIGPLIFSVQPRVALRKESVDRNTRPATVCHPTFGSLSARRAWIEMFLKRSKTMKNRSLSARRAWIEIETSASPLS